MLWLAKTTPHSSSENGRDPISAAGFKPQAGFLWKLTSPEARSPPGVQKDT